MYKTIHKRTWTLQRVLVAYSLLDKGFSKDTVSLMMKIDKRMFWAIDEQRQTTIVNGKKVTWCRSLLKHLYEDHKDPDNDRLVSSELFLSRLFDDYGEHYRGGELGKQQIRHMIEDWELKNSLMMVDL